MTSLNLNLFFILQLNLEAIYAESKKLNETVQHIVNGSVSKEILEIRFPLGVPPPSLPETRHDLLVWSLMNETHQIMPNSEENVIALSKIDKEDVKVKPNMLKMIYKILLNEYHFSV